MKIAVLFISPLLRDYSSTKHNFDYLKIKQSPLEGIYHSVSPDYHAVEPIY